MTGQDKKDVSVAHIDDPAGGITTDTEARAAIDLILVALENAGIVRKA